MTQIENHNYASLLVFIAGNYHQDYDGEAYLCPPNEKPHGLQTILGLMQIVLIRGSGSEYYDKQTRSVSTNKHSDVPEHFQAAKRDSYCRQLGFTNAVSVHALSEVSSLYHFNGTGCKL